MTPQPELRAELNASFDAAIAEAERIGYISCEEGDRRAAELLKRLDAEPADQPAMTGLAAPSPRD